MTMITTSCAGRAVYVGPHEIVLNLPGPLLGLAVHTTSFSMTPLGWRTPIPAQGWALIGPSDTRWLTDGGLRPSSETLRWDRRASASDIVVITRLWCLHASEHSLQLRTAVEVHGAATSIDGRTQHEPAVRLGTIKLLGANGMESVGSANELFLTEMTLVRA